MNVNAEERLARASELFIRLQADDAQDADHARLKQWLDEHPDNAGAYREASAAWDVIGQFASSPQLMRGRRHALEDAQRARKARESKAPRWRSWYGLAAGVSGVALLSWVLWFISLQGDLYATGLGDRRVLTLSDGSIVNLDASSRMRVSYGEDARVIDLESGQASFEVMRDPARPFRVRSGEHTVIALGTQFNVEILRDRLLVTLIEGRVAVTPEPSALAQGSGEGVVELAPGQQLIAAEGAPPRVRSDIDLGRATAWHDGKLFFNDEPLADAAARMNRYARLRIEVDPEIDGIGISGVFKAGDTNAFIDAVTTYFPVRAERTEDGQIRLMKVTR